MPTNTRVDDLKINKLTVSQYRNAVANHTIGENEISVLTDAIIVQTDTMPIASAEYDGKIVQYTGVTSSPYVCGYFYVCTGSSDVYNWNQINVQPEKDAHNLGYYSTPEDLVLVHPTATAGDYAIVNSTDTVWIWDTDTSSWKDGDTQGQVTSVNNRTGDVVLTASDLGAQEELPSQSGQSGKFLTTDGSNLSWGTADALPSQAGHLGEFLTTDGYDADWSPLATVATTGEYSDLIGKPTIPAAQVNSDWDAVSGVAQILNKPTIPTVGNGTITITQGGVTKGTFSTNQSGDTTIDIDAGGSSLPSQTGHSGEFLTTDGTDASWGSPIVATFKVWGANE